MFPMFRLSLGSILVCVVACCGERSMEGRTIEILSGSFRKAFDVEVRSKEGVSEQKTRFRVVIEKAEDRIIFSFENCVAEDADGKERTFNREPTVVTWQSQKLQLPASEKGSGLTAKTMALLFFDVSPKKDNIFDLVPYSASLGFVINEARKGDVVNGHIKLDILKPSDPKQAELERQLKGITNKDAIEMMKKNLEDTPVTYTYGNIVLNVATNWTESATIYEVTEFGKNKYISEFRLKSIELK